MNDEQFKKFSYAQYILHTREMTKNGKIKAKWILLPYGKWFDQRFPFEGRLILDYGALIESNIFKKSCADNQGGTHGYWGYDIEQSSVQWLSERDIYYDAYGDDRLKGEFDYVFAMDVYEHLDPEDRIKFLKRSHELLKEGGRLVVSFPCTKKLNILANFVSDWTHKLVGCEMEVPAFVYFRGFNEEKVRLYIGGWTLEFRSLTQNLLSIIRNLLCFLPPFCVTTIVAEKG
jgi:SAM-dependent methyltransferase